MLKLLVLVALVLAVLYIFSLRGRRPPGDWRRDDDDDGPVVPTGRIGLDDQNRPSAPPPPDDTLEETGAGRGSGDRQRD
jgi:hypothetical protein